MNFQKIVKMYKERLYWHIRGIVYNHDDAADVLQNTFIKIHTKASSFREKSSIYTWIYRIATNEALQFLRKEAKRKKISIEETLLLETLKAEQDPYYRGDDIEWALQRALSQLPEQQFLIFKMRYFQELTYKDIAEILVCSEGNVKASYHHARKKVEKFLIKTLNLSQVEASKRHGTK